MFLKIKKKKRKKTVIKLIRKENRCNLSELHKMIIRLEWEGEDFI